MKPPENHIEPIPAMLSQPSFVLRWSLNILGVAALALIVFALYGRTLHYDLIFDDRYSITTNDSIKQLTPLFGTEDSYGPLRPAPNTPLGVRPLVNLTFAVNYHFGGTDPWGYRLVNVIGHTFVAVLLWAIITTTLRQPVFGLRFVEWSKWLGFWGALIWMVHPTHQDAVVYVTQRTDLQMGLFYALTILLSIGYWKCNNWWAKLLMCVAATTTSSCGMLCKEMAASIPAMIALYEWTFIGGSLSVMLKRSWLLYLGLILSWAPIAAIYASGLGTPLAGFNNLIPAYDYWLTQSRSFFYYWRLTFYPWPLILHYHVPTLHSMAEAWPAVVGFSAYAVLTAVLVWKRKVLGFVLLWYFAVLSPTLIVPLPHEEIAERRLYVTLFAVLPAIAVYLMVQLSLLWQRWRNGYSQVADRISMPYAALACLPILGLTLASAVVFWRSVPRLAKTEEIWTHVLKYQPDNNFAITSQGLEEIKQGLIESGLAKVERAYQSEPTYTFIATSLVHALDWLQKYPRMLEVCREQYEMYPDNPERVFDLAAALEKDGRLAHALEKYREAIELAPDFWIAHSSLATLLAEAGKYREAIHHFEIASEIHPDVMNYVNLLTLYLNTNQREKATEVIPKVLAHR